MEALPYFGDEWGALNEELFGEFQGLTPPVFQPDNILFQLQDTTEALGDIPSLFGELPYDAGPYSADLYPPISQLPPATDFTLDEFQNVDFSAPSFVPPWSDQIPTPAPTLEQALPIEPPQEQIYTHTPDQIEEQIQENENGEIKEEKKYEETDQKPLSVMDTMRQRIRRADSFDQNRVPRQKRKAIRRAKASIKKEQRAAVPTVVFDVSGSVTPFQPPASAGPSQTPDVEEGPPVKKIRGPPKSLITVFDANTTPQVKKNTRKTYSDEARNKVASVRKIGACIQCKIRKRTCGTGWPCSSCFRRAGDVQIASQICIRESPFEDLTVTEFYGSSSRTRVVDFVVNLSSVHGSRSTITIGVKGKVSYPVDIEIRQVQTASLDTELVERINDIPRLRLHAKSLESNGSYEPEFVSMLDESALAAIDVVKFAVEYTYKCAKVQQNIAATPIFLFAVEYARRSLPNSSLLVHMTKLFALHFILIRGVKMTTEPHGSDIDMSVIYAQIDTKVFQCLYETEKAVYNELHKLIFKSSGQLTRDVVLPVSLTFSLMLRIQAHRACVMANIRPSTSNVPVYSTNGEVKTSVSHQDRALNLMSGVNKALFRNMTPLLLDFESQFNRDLVGDDAHLRGIAKGMQESIRMIAQVARIILKPYNRSLGFSRDRILQIVELYKDS